MEMFYTTFGFVGAVVLGIVILTLFFKVVSLVQIKMGAPALIKMKGFLKDAARINVMKGPFPKSIGVFIAVALIAGCSGCMNHPKDTVAALKRDSALQLTAFTISGFYEAQPFSISFSEPGVLQYLSAVLRVATNAVGSGMSFSIKLCLNNGVESNLGLDLPIAGKNFYIWVSKPFPSDGIEYCATLAEPIPKEFSEALAKIRTGQLTNRESVNP